ncbi:hypothetical protein SAMN04490202_0873 [Pseudomonas reinekei]|uniref:HNH endonuclease n=1 Tax=Pseudomonas reinekei TaxID=395598 RepID=A0A1H0JIG5_PSERE|nr:hypothetical protein [Pseudomonas reinekei]KAB0483860.1 HNH endonuclease [Pseudomonas reinekei]OLU00925.1 hypothetical protein BVK86_20590 [Pseudomonas reinekei]SDO43273.1 hypothetical protein SAMN04490202_0873 [Pseudomonas reinekei]
MSSQPTNATPQCIYCEKPGPFSDEHVISAGLGADDDRFLLVDMVCRRCNTDVFGNLEREVLRSSPIAIARAFMQPHGRNRGKHTTAPGIQARHKQMANSSGHPDEVDFGPHAQPIVLPQLKMIDDSLLECSAPGPDEQRSFILSLSSLLQGNEITCIRKRGPEHELRYEAITLLRSGMTFTQADGSSFQPKPPRGGLWLERYDETRTEGVSPAATIFKNLNGGIVLKTSSATVEDALNFFACAVEQVSFDSQVTSDNENPIVSVGMTVTIGAMERVIAKIGINLLAYYLGRDYVTDTRFRSVKDSILTGVPRLGSQIVKNAAITTMLNAAPDNHHVFFLSTVSQPGGRLAIILTAKLYGVAHFMPLALDVPKPHQPLPVYFLVDYLNHEVKQRSLVEYIEYLVEMDITKAQARYGSSS